MDEQNVNMDDAQREVSGVRLFLATVFIALGSLAVLAWSFSEYCEYRAMKGTVPHFCKAHDSPFAENKQLQQVPKEKK